MTIEQAIVNIKKELKCRTEEVPNCENTICMDCPYNVSHENLTDTLQTLYDWINAERRIK